MLYKLRSGVDVFEDNPGLRSVEAYANLSSMQMFFVCLVADISYDNPLRSLPEKSRREKAARIAGYGMEKDGKRPDKNSRNIITGKVESVEKAIAVYREYQFDEDKVNLQAAEQQISEIRDFLSSDKKLLAGDDPKVYAQLLKDAISIGKGLSELVTTKKNLEELLKNKEPIRLEVDTYTAADLPQETVETDDTPMSTIDLVMAKKKNRQE